MSAARPKARIVRAGAALLWCLSWHAALPAATLTGVERSSPGSERLTADHLADSLASALRLSETRELARESHRDRLDLPLPRVVRSVAPQPQLRSLGTNAWLREGLHRLTYPARSRLRRAAGGARVDEPAA